MVGGVYPGGAYPAGIVVAESVFDLAFGDATNTFAGELFTIPYTSSTTITHAELILGDGRHLELTIGPSSMQVLLPPDTPTGWASIYAEDDEDHSGTFPNVAFLTGAVAPEVNPIRGSGTGGARTTAETHRVVTRSTLAISSTTLERQWVSSATPVNATSHTAIRARAVLRGSRVSTSFRLPLQAKVVSRSSFEIDSRSQSRVWVQGRSSVPVSSSTATRRRDSDELEALLLSL